MYLNRVRLSRPQQRKVPGSTRKQSFHPISTAESGGCRCVTKVGQDQKHEMGKDVALRKSRLKGGETVAIYGVGGLGVSAIQLAYAFGALDVYAVDINADKLKLAEKYGAIPVNASVSNPVTEIRSLTQGKGVDVALEVIGLPQTMKQAVQSLAAMGRAVVAGISDKPLELDTYRELIGREGEVIGTSDHLLHELPLLLELARRGKLNLSETVTRTVPLDADAINQVLDNLEQFHSDVRTVIMP